MQDVFFILWELAYKEAPVYHPEPVGEVHPHGTSTLVGSLCELGRRLGVTLWSSGTVSDNKLQKSEVC